MKRGKKKINKQQLIDGLDERHVAQIIRRKMITRVVPNKKKDGKHKFDDEF